MIAWLLSQIFSARTLERALRLKNVIMNVSVMTETDLNEMEKAHAIYEQAEFTRERSQSYH